MMATSAIRFLLGPKRDSEILFLGFYDVFEKPGYLKRTRLSKTVDTHFFAVLESSFRNHGVQDYEDIPVLDCRPSNLIYRWCDPARFSRIAASYSEKSLGVVWGTVDNNAIKTLEVKLNTGRYRRNPKG